MVLRRRVRRPGSVPGLVPPLDAAAPWVVAPPPRPVVDSSGVGQTLLGALGSLSMVGFAIVGGNRLFLFIALGLAALTLTATLGARFHSSRRARAATRALRERWRAHLDLQVGGAVRSAEVQRAERQAAHPGVGGLLARARGGIGLWWETAPDRAEPWLIRVGAGRVPARQPLACDPGTDPLAEVDSELVSESCAAVELARWVDDAPVVLSWPVSGALALVGPLEDARAVARAIVAELLVRKPPGQLRITIDTAQPQAWSWLAWLPHDIALGGAAGGADVFISESGVSDGRTLLLVPTIRAAPASAQVLDLIGLPFMLPGGETVTSWVGLEDEQATRLGRSLAPRAMPGPRGQGLVGARFGGQGSGSQGSGGPQSGGLGLVGARFGGQSSGGQGSGGHRPGGTRPADLSLFDLLEPAAERRWDLRVPLGVAEDGDVWLDLREPAAGGDGPHGLLIGATGSGKSELLRSLVLGLAWRHPPEELAFVLADWKGGAAFDDVAALPHVAGLMTNLSDDQRQVSRVATALRAELTRRQLILREAAADSVSALRERDPTAAPPALVVVLDEFGELLAAEPDILDVLVACGRLGRSLGVHLLLSSQRFEEGRLRGLESHLRYRVCLRVSAASESQGVIGTADAAALPSEPGWGYLSVDGHNRRFRAAHTSRAVRDPAVITPALQPLALPWRVLPQATSGGGETERAQAVQRILELGRPRVAPVWHPPLPSELLWPSRSGSSWSLPLGILDDVAGQAQPPWLLDLETCGHTGIVAGPGAGTSSLLRSIICAGAEALPSDALGLIVVDFGGLDRAGLAELPHLRCLAGPEDPDLALAGLRWAAQVVEARGQHARRHGLTGPAGWRQAREAGRLGELAGDQGADLLVIVDGLARARDDVEEIDALLGIIAGGGLRVRVRLVLSGQRWGDFRPGLRDLLSTRWELRLTDVGESGFSREVAALSADAPPGRVVTSAGLLAQAYLPPELPRSRGGSVVARLLPLPALISSRPAAQLALRAGDLAPLSCDARGHLLILGDRGSGRTSLLNRVLTACSSDPLARRVILIDPRRGLTAHAQRPGVRWTSGGGDTDAVVAELTELLTERRLGSAAAGPLGGRWWSGPEHLLVIDDSDLVPGGAYGGALAPLAEFVRIGPDLGFGIAMARPVTGLTRNGFEPFTAAVREAATTTVLLRGDPGEGAVAGGLRARSDRPPGRCSWIGETGAVDAQLVFDREPACELRLAVA